MQQLQLPALSFDTLLRPFISLWELLSVWVPRRHGFGVQQMDSHTRYEASPAWIAWGSTFVPQPAAT